MTLSNPKLKYSVDYDKQWDNELTPNFAIVKSVKTERRHAGSSEKRIRAKQPGHRRSRTPNVGASCI